MLQNERESIDVDDLFKEKPLKASECEAWRYSPAKDTLFSTTQVRFNGCSVHSATTKDADVMREKKAGTSSV